MRPSPRPSSQIAVAMNTGKLVPHDRYFVFP
jgi:hypothetical protein